MVRKKDDAWKTFQEMVNYINTHIVNLNQSKVFAGIVIIVLNISSKFVNIQLSKSMEAYLKYTFSRNILIFAMAWMGTRDIYTALFITGLFWLFTTYFLNEESPFCCLPESFTTHHENMQMQNTPTQDQINQAIVVLSQVKTKDGNTSAAGSAIISNPSTSISASSWPPSSM